MIVAYSRFECLYDSRDLLERYVTPFLHIQLNLYTLMMASSIIPDSFNAGLFRQAIAANSDIRQALHPTLINTTRFQNYAERQVRCNYKIISAHKETNYET